MVQSVKKKARPPLKHVKPKHDSIDALVATGHLIGHRPLTREPTEHIVEAQSAINQEIRSQILRKNKNALKKPEADTHLLQMSGSLGSISILKQVLETDALSNVEKTRVAQRIEKSESEIQQKMDKFMRTGNIDTLEDAKGTARDLNEFLKKRVLQKHAQQKKIDELNEKSDLEDIKELSRHTPSNVSEFAKGIRRGNSKEMAAQVKRIRFMLEYQPMAPVKKEEIESHLKAIDQGLDRLREDEKKGEPYKIADSTEPVWEHLKQATLALLKATRMRRIDRKEFLAKHPPQNRGQ